MKLEEENVSGDQELVDQVIAEFLRAAAVGQAGDPRQWLDRYPTCAAALAEFFDNRAQFEHIVILDRSDLPTSAIQPNANGDGPKARFSAEIDTLDFAPEPPRLSGSRYRPVRFHARGGMGEIWLAHDERIGRQVAVKKLRSGRNDQQPRFLVEAQITGQLEHPSIVPLHDLGLDDAGKPYYIMKFIHGRRLSEAIAAYHAQRSSTDWPSDLEFRKLLETLVHVCNVVAYAHNKKVLHRDIKPDNVMLGPYGETLVVDWGLAKVIGQPDEADDSDVRLSGSGSTATQEGAVVGSPYYMPPEGAEGRPEAVDRSSDVYLLGATLYQILTGQPPRQGSSNWELIDLALHSRPTNPRRLDKSIPCAIEAICLKAMAYHKQERYQTPLALADDIQRFLAGQPTSAFREPLVTRIGRWFKRHRRGLFRGLTAACLISLAGLAAMSHHQAQALAEQELARQQLSEFYRLADDAQFFAANTDAIAERVPYYDPGRATKVGEAALTIAAPWGELADQLPLRDARENFLRRKYELLLLMAQADLGVAGQPSAARDALALLDKANAIQQPSRGYFQLRKRCQSLLGEQDAAKREDKPLIDKNIEVTASDHFLQGEMLRVEDSGAGGSSLGDDATEPPRDHLTKAVEEYRQALQIDPQHYWARFQLGRCLFALGRAPEAIETLSACIALRPTSPWAYSARGLASALAGHREQALDDLDRAVQLDPSFYPARLNRGVVYWLLDKNDTAIADFNAVLAAPADQRLMEAAFYRGQLLLKDQHDRQSLQDFSAVVDALPDFRPAYWLRAKVQFRLGNNEAGCGDIQKFLDLGRRAPANGSQSEKSIALGTALRKLAQELEGDARTHVLILAADQLEAGIATGTSSAAAFQHLGAVCERLNKPSAAIDAYSRGLAVSADNLRLLNMRGWAYSAEKKLDLARADFTKALRLAPGNPESHAGLGFVSAQAGKDDDARREAGAALLSGSDNYLVLHNVACIYGRLSETEVERKLEHENLSLAMLARAAEISRRHTTEPDADELALIRREDSFPASLRSRPEFQRLLAGEASSHR